MANVEGLVPFPVKRWGGGADWDDPSQIPLGLAVVCKNCRFQVEGVGTRFGSKHTMQTSGVGDFTGLEVLQTLGDTAQQIPLVYSDRGVLLRETPPGSGTLVPVSPPILLPASASMLTSKAYNSIFAAFSDLETPLIPPLVLNGVTGALNPASQNPIGSLWTPGRFAQIGDLVRSSTDTTRWFRCTSPGKMGETEPTWPVNYGYFQTVGSTTTWIPATAQDQGGGRSVWEEWTPIATSEIPTPTSPTTLVQNAGAGSIPAGQDVYFKISYVVLVGSVTGETATTGFVFPNTAGNAQIVFDWGSTVGGPFMPSWMSMIIKESLRFNAFSLRVYVAAVPTGTAAPADGAYKWGGDFAVTEQIAISFIPNLALPVTSGPALVSFFQSTFSFTPGAGSHLQVGAGDGPPQPPAGSGTLAFIPPGFIGTAGGRKMIVLRQDSQGSLSSVDPDSVLSVNFDGSGQANILTMGRDASGNVTAIVSDISNFVAGKQAVVDGSTDPSFDGNMTLATVANAGYIAPQGVITWPSSTMSASSATGGTLTGTAGNLPVAFVPPGGDNDTIDIAAFTVQGADAGGPFFFIDSADPADVVVLQIVSLQRIAGVVRATLKDASAVTPGTDLAIAGLTSSTELNGLVSVGTVDQNVLTYSQPGPDTSLVTGGTATIVQELPTGAANPPGGSIGIPLNFDDNFLSNANDVTDQLTAIPAPPSTHIYFSPSLRKLVYTTGTDSNHYFSDTDDPANIQDPDGILSVENNNGSKTVGFVEMISGELLSLKENGGYAIQVGADNPPSEWTPTRRWDGHGPCGPQAWDLGPDFLIIFDVYSGPYRYYQGALAQVGHEKQGTWDRINKDAKAQIWVAVDDDLKQVRIGLPLDGATVPNKEMVLDYFNGWDEPVIINYVGELIPNRYGRRWSEDDRLARVGKRLKRTLAIPVDQRIDQRQMLYAMENPLLTSTVTAEEVQLDSATNPMPTLPFGDYYIQVAKVVNGVEVEYTRVMGPFQVTQVLINGEIFWQSIRVNLPGDQAEDSYNVYIGFTAPYGASTPPFNQVVSAPNNVTVFMVNTPGAATSGPSGTMSVDMTVPDTLDDSGAGIDSQYQPAFFSVPTLDIVQWQTLKARAVGAGNLILQPVTEDGSQAIRPLIANLDSNGGNPYKFSKGFGPIQNELLSILISNGAVAGAGFHMHALVLYGAPIYSSRKG